MSDVGRPFPARWIAPLLLSLILLAGTTTPLRAQEAPRSPEVVADEFNRGFQTRQWAGLVQRIHSEGLAYLRLAVDILIEYDASGAFLEQMIGASAADYAALPDGEVLVRALRWVERNYPGMLSAFSDRRTTVLGEIREGDDRHVVYRTIQIVQGAVPQLRVVTLSMENGAWRVRDGQDITSLHTALRGIPRPADSGRPTGREGRSVSAGLHDQRQLGVRGPLRHGPVVEPGIEPKRPSGEDHG